jgi:hypothetical protein
VGARASTLPRAARRIDRLTAEQRVHHVLEGAGARRRPGGPIAVAAILVLLVAVVAAATRASLSRVGSAPPRLDTAPIAADVVVGVLLVVAVAGMTLLVVGLQLLRRRKKGDDLWDDLFDVPPPPWYERLIHALVPLALLLTVIIVVLTTHKRVLVPPGPPGGAAQAPSRLHEPARGRGVEIDWLPILIAVGVAALAAAAAFLLLRARLRNARRTAPPPVADEVVQAIDESLDDLEHEPDPRRAVIRAYGRMERALGAHGVARRAPETPLEYLARALQALAASREAAQRLTRLFERAKFSRHPIDVRMKDEAIGALAALRTELEQR